MRPMGPSTAKLTAAGRGVPSRVRVTAVRLAASPAAASVAGGPLHEREASRPRLEGAPEATTGSEFGAEPRFAAR